MLQQQFPSPHEPSCPAQAPDNDCDNAPAEAARVSTATSSENGTAAPLRPQSYVHTMYPLYKRQPKLLAVHIISQHNVFNHGFSSLQYLLPPTHGSQVSCLSTKTCRPGGSTRCHHRASRQFGKNCKQLAPLLLSLSLTTSNSCYPFTPAAPVTLQMGMGNITCKCKCSSCTNG